MASPNVPPHRKASHSTAQSSSPAPSPPYSSAPSGSSSNRTRFGVESTMVEEEEGGGTGCSIDFFWMTLF